MSNDKYKMTSIFPLIKRFQDVKCLHSTVMLSDECKIHDKYFRSGSVFFIRGWREINSEAYIILNKGSWEALVKYDDFREKLQDISK
jgi:hypothetical protein